MLCTFYTLTAIFSWPPSSSSGVFPPAPLPPQLCTCSLALTPQTSHPRHQPHQNILTAMFSVEKHSHVLCRAAFPIETPPLGALGFLCLSNLISNTKEKLGWGWQSLNYRGLTAFTINEIGNSSDNYFLMVMSEIFAYAKQHFIEVATTEVNQLKLNKLLA